MIEIKLNKIIILIFWILTFYHNSDAIVVSDTTKIKSMPDDTTKCNLILKIAEELRDYNTEIGLDYAKMGLDLAQKLNFKRGIAGGYKALGLNFWRMGVYDSAIENYFIAINRYKEINDYNAVCRCYNNIGLVYFAKSDYVKAKDYLYQALTIAEKLKSDMEQSRVLHNLGLVEFQGDNKHIALQFFLKSYTFANSANDLALMAYNNCFIGRTYAYINQYDSAKVHLELSIKIFKELENPNTIAMAYNQYSDYYMQIKNYNKAIEFANYGFKLGEEVGNKYMMMEAAGLISKAYTKLEAYKKALEYNIKYYELSDTMVNESNSKNFAQLEAKYEYENKLKELKTSKEKEIYKSQLIAKSAIVLAFLLFVISVVIFIFYRWKSKTNKILLQKNEEISELNIKLEKLNVTKDKFFTIIAHDLKNPLGSFRDITSLLHDAYSDFTEIERIDFLNLIKQSANNIYTLLGNLLEWSRSQRGIISFNPTQFDLSVIATNTVDLLSPASNKKNIKIENSIPNSTMVNADPNLITTILRNLISNAIKFTPEGGKIEIGAIYKSSGSSIYIYVKDSGIGMTDKTINKLFRIDVNVTTPGTNQENGTGLGLILCKEFVEKHNGEIWVESELGKGSTFKFSLPI